jgi:hypothetical protein
VVRLPSGARSLRPQEEEAFFEAAADLVCALLQAPAPASEPWRLPPELSQQAHDAVGAHGLSLAQVDLMLRAYQGHAPSQEAIQARVRQRCPQQAQGRGGLDLGSLPLPALLARHAPLQAQPAAQLPPEGQHYVRVAGQLGCLGLKGTAENPEQARGELLAQEGLTEQRWRQLGRRWRADAGASTALARALAGCQ